MTAMTATREIVAAEPRELVAPSALLGPLAVPRDQVYRFPSGIYGFPDARTFVLLPDDAEGCFWLQSLEHADLTFLLVDPFRFVPGYVVEFAPGTWSDLSADAHDLLVLAIVTLPQRKGDPPTLNLQGPLVLDVASRRGRQVVVETVHGVRHPIALTTADAP